MIFRYICEPGKLYLIYKPYPMYLVTIISKINATGGGLHKLLQCNNLIQNLLEAVLQHS